MQVSAVDRRMLDVLAAIDSKAPLDSIEQQAQKLYLRLWTFGTDLESHLNMHRTT